MLAAPTLEVVKGDCEALGGDVAGGRMWCAGCVLMGTDHGRVDPDVPRSRRPDLGVAAALQLGEQQVPGAVG